MASYRKNLLRCVLKTGVANWRNMTHSEKTATFKAHLYPSKYGNNNVEIQLPTYNDVVVDAGSETAQVWEANHEYNVGDIVAINDSKYECLKAHTSGSEFELTEDAPAPYDASKLYNVGDTVEHEGVCFYCVNANVEPTPFIPENWEQFVLANLWKIVE